MSRPQSSPHAGLIVAGGFIIFATLSSLMTLIPMTLTGDFPASRQVIGAIFVLAAIACFGARCVYLAFRPPNPETFSAAAWLSETPWYFVPIMGVGSLFLIPPISFMHAIGAVGVLRCLAEIVSVFFHESGHALAALAFGGRLTRFEFWPVALTRGDAGWKWSWRTRRGGLTGFGRVRQPSRRNMILLTAAGPFMDFAVTVLGIVLFVLRLASRPDDWSSDPIALGALAVTWVSGISVIFNLWPHEFANGHESDGAEIRAYLTLPAQFFEVDPELLLQALSGKKPEEWKLSIDECVARLRPVNVDAGLGLSYVAGMALDSNRLDVVRALLAWDRTGAGANALETLRTTEAYLAALEDHDPAKARSILATLLSGPDAPLYANLLEAAIHVVEGDAATARAKLTRWLEETRRAPNPGLRETGNRWAIDRVQQRLAELEQQPLATPETA